MDDPASTPRTPRLQGNLSMLGPFQVPDVPGERILRIYEPPLRPRARPRPRPLLLLWDGQNTFEDEPSFAGGWHVHSLCDQRSARGRVTPVVVGIHHGGEQRLRELSPWEFQGQSPLLEPMLDWLEQWLVPMVRQQFQLGGAGTVVGGSSMGGLASLYALMTRPRLFQGALAMSSSLFLARGRLLELAGLHPPSPQARLYLDAGGREAGGKLLRMHEQLVHVLRNNGCGPPNFLWRAVKSGQHSEASWRRRLPVAFRHLFGP